MRGPPAYKHITFYCSKCEAPYYVRPCDVKRRKTTLCQRCILAQRNRLPKMREAARRNASEPKSYETRQKLSQAQNRYWTEKQREARAGAGNPAWRGGRTVSMGGYVYACCPGHPRATKKGQYVFEHILVMEGHLGRLLKEGEVVHHANGDKTNNHIENLVLYQSHSEHLREAHGRKR